MGRKGILLAGGSGTRLYPLTNFVCKQLLPVYNKPLIYYPLYTLLKAGITDILIISTPETTPILKDKLGTGCSNYHLNYAVQEKPNGIAQSFIIAENFIGRDSVCLILGDNIFFGSSFNDEVRRACCLNDNTIFCFQVSNPGRYGVAVYDENGKVVEIEEKPNSPKSNSAVSGIYFYENDVIEIAKELKPSKRGELEITDINNRYISEQRLSSVNIGTGNAWFDAGTFESLNDASNFVRTIEERTGIKVNDLGEFQKENK